MAKVNIAKFFNLAMTDKALAEKAAALASANGFDITAAELLELGTARPLDDAAVETAAGGHSNEEQQFLFEAAKALRKLHGTN